MRMRIGAGPLVPCTPATIPGRVVPGAPGVAVLEDVVYRPLRNPLLDQDPGWGIYGRDGALIEAACYWRGPGRSLIGQSPRQDAGVAGHASGTFVYGGVFISHFGHFLLSTLARLWPFADPFLASSLRDFPILLHAASDPADWFATPHVAELFAALGLGPERFVRLTEPSAISRLIVPLPSLVEMSQVHPAYVHMTRAIGARLSDGVASPPGGPVWLSRTRLPVATQGFENEDALEAVLAGMGVEILYPETRPVGEMAALFASRPVIAGTVASAFHAALFCPRPAPMVVLSPSPMVNPSFPMLDQAAGHDARYFHIESDHLGIDMRNRIWSTFRLRDPAATAASLLAAMQDAAR
ncbi:MAG TPA: glycosyltransferase family 61 protein [Acetobacteraceae bacterium]|nr:glycosyltransferase family 61 protein [Acetobacteraceae bacterium]